MISNKYSPIPFVFVHANKTGGNSINAALEQYGYKYPNDHEFTHDDILYPHSQHWTVKELSLVVDIKKYYTFSISRNPWDRMVSYYRKNVCNPLSTSYVDIEFNDWIDLAFIKKETPEYIITVDDRYSHKGSQYAKKHDGRRDIEECYYYVIDSDGKIAVDFVIEFSYLKLGFKTVCNKLGIDIALPELSQMKSDVKTHDGKFFNIESYHDMYNHKSIGIIEKAFENDILMFGYSYE